MASTSIPGQPPDALDNEPTVPFGSGETRRLMATGIGSWPGTDQLAAQRAVFDTYAGASDVLLVPYLAEVPDRGAASDMIGRGCATLVDLPTELHSAGWKLSSGEGRDLNSARLTLASDLDSLAEVADGYEGPVKLQLVGPWTLCSSLWLPRGERVLADAGACRDVVASLAEGVATLVRDTRARLAAQVDLVVQFDEPAWPMIAQGGVPTLSGMNRYRPVSQGVLREGLRTVRDHALAAGASATWWHSCATLSADEFGIAADVDALLVDVTHASIATWEHIVAALDAGQRIGLGLESTTIQRMSPAQVSERLWSALSTIGMTQAYCDQIVILPSCGFATARFDDSCHVSAQISEIAARFQSQCAQM